MLTSPVSFLQRPARWMHLMASDFHAFSAAPNFAFELAARRTTDDDMAGRDLGNILTILSGSERVQAATIKRFADRFARFNLQERVIRPSYGLAEATVYVATSKPGQPPETVDFDTESLSAGHAKPCAGGGAIVDQLHVAAVTDRADRRLGHLHRMSGRNRRRDLGARRQRR